VTSAPGAGSGQQHDDEVVEFGSGRSAGRPWLSRAVLACLVAAAAVTLGFQAFGQHARPDAKARSRLPAVRVTTVGHPLLGVTAGWQLLARGPDDLVRIQLAQGRITQTYVPPLVTGNPDVAFLLGAHEVIIRSSDQVPGYVVPDGGQARLLTGPLAGSGPAVPGPAGSQALWVMSGPPTMPALALITLAGHRAGPTIRFAPGAPELAATAVSDGRGYLLVTSGGFNAYDAGPGWDRSVPGTVIAVGPASWLVVACNAQYQHCRNEVIDSADGSRRVLRGRAAAEPYDFAWPPTGVIAPDSGAAAVIAIGPDGKELVRLIDLRTGRERVLGVSLGQLGSGLVDGENGNQHSLAWSPDGRWLFVAAAGGRLVAVNARTGQAQSLGVALPPTDQVAIRG
jgi:hypothetical protein